MGAPSTWGKGRLGKSMICSWVMKPREASMATRPCTSSDSRQRFTSATELALPRKLKGSKMSADRHNYDLGLALPPQ